VYVSLIYRLADCGRLGWISLSLAAHTLSRLQEVTIRKTTIAVFTVVNALNLSEVWTSLDSRLQDIYIHKDSSSV
jgi:hypothetical protein